MATAVQPEEQGPHKVRATIWSVVASATPSTPAKYVVCTYESFERIRDVHLELEHAGVGKTYGQLKGQYYGITKKEVAWLIARCIPCQVGFCFCTHQELSDMMQKLAAKKKQSTITLIISSAILERV
jgi:hypothetical protein